MASPSAINEGAHPAPHRHRVGIGTLLFCIIAPPAIWGLRLLVNYALTSRSCFPAELRHEASPPGLQWLWPTLTAFDAATIAVALVCAAISYQSWRRSREEADSSAGELVELGEGRTRFMALWGGLVSILFCVAAVFDFAFLLAVPICG